MRYFYDRYWGLFSTTDPRLVELERKDIVGVGYSGKSAYLNDVDYDDLANQGCLPAALYTITAVDSEKGPLTFHLTPAFGSDMHGRSGFLIHGDTPSMDHTASEGCIVSPHWTRSLFAVGDEIEAI